MTTNDDCYVGGYWSGRKEAVESCAARCIRFLQRISEWVPTLARWYLTADSREEALLKQITLDEAGLQKLVAEVTRSSDLRGTGDDGSGHHTSLWNGEDDRNSAGIRIHCGARDSPVPNACILELPAELPGTRPVLQGTVLRRLLESMVTSWDPDWAVVASKSLREQFVDRRPGAFVGWLTYVKVPQEDIPKLAVQVVPFHRGVLVIASVEPLKLETKSWESLNGIFRVLKKSNVLHPVSDNE